jgi:hypothetical protein
MKKIIKSKKMEISNETTKRNISENDFFCDIVCIAVMEYRGILRKKMIKEGIEKNKIKKILEL